MIKLYPADSRYSANHGWLQCNFSFSFADYHDPSNMNFGPLRVFNDDFIQPGEGFGTHPHRDMEIVTFVLKGQLQHKDNTGGEEVLRPGEVQRMTAGTGILHSEMNTSIDELNIFEIAVGQSNQKSWYYTRDGSVEYDHEKGLLTIYANSKIDYPV